ncbi:MAG: helix-turn-helix domain-containing protein [Clostridia bacterium]|nr:helix-turn-helix domain-containing protein [Clostridia bacterium]
MSFYNSELQLLCETFRKSRVHTWIEEPNELENRIASLGIEGALGMTDEARSALPRRFPHTFASRTMYKITDAFGFSYIALLLPDEQSAKALCIGPYLTSTPSPERILEIGEATRVPRRQQKYLEEYYFGISVLTDRDHLFMMLDAFCERLWRTPSFFIIDQNQENQIPASPINDISQNDSFHETLMNVKAMEERYVFENELIKAVELGQIHKEKQLRAAFSQNAFEKRVADPLRNAKNYGIIMNTLLRKAAEQGGVHPVYLDRVSSKIAMQIEQLPSLSENTDLMCSIFRAYCRLVRNHSLKQFSQVVQKTILLIDSDLSASLSLNALARQQSISSGYLSTIFKKETGKTVSEYIREKRIKHASHLLATTNLQIQTVALHCGIMDVQYFSKTFKRLTGKTPKEYRESIKRPQTI